MATHHARTFKPNTHSRLPEFIVTAHETTTAFILTSPLLSNQLINCTDITEIIKYLKPKKASRYGEFNNITLTILPNKVITYIHHIFEACINIAYTDIASYFLEKGENHISQLRERRIITGKWPSNQSTTNTQQAA
jgi:hypothetical protein